MEEQHSNDGFRERNSGLAVTSIIIVGIALGLQVAGVATDYWITTASVAGEYATTGIWKECVCKRSGCFCIAVKVVHIWRQVYAATTSMGMAMTLIKEILNTRQEQTSSRNSSRFISKGLTLICAVTLLIGSVVDDDHYSFLTPSSSLRTGYSFILCAVAALLIGVDVLIGIVEIRRMKPTPDDDIAHPRTRRDRASVMRQNDMNIEYHRNVPQQLPIDRQRLNMRRY